MTDLNTENVSKKKVIRGEAAIIKFKKLLDSVHPDDQEAFYEYVAKRWFSKEAH